MPPTLACTLLLLYALVMTFLCFTVNYFRQQHLAKIDLQSSRIDALDRECSRLEQAGLAIASENVRLVGERNAIRNRIRRDDARSVLFISLKDGHTDSDEADAINTLKSCAPCSTLP